MNTLKLLFIITLYPTYGFCIETSSAQREEKILNEIKQFIKDINDLNFTSFFQPPYDKISLEKQREQTIYFNKLKEDLKTLLRKKNSTIDQKIFLYTVAKHQIMVSVGSSILHIKKTSLEVGALIHTLSTRLSENFPEYSDQEIKEQLAEKIFSNFERSDCNKITPQTIYTLVSSSDKKLNRVEKNKINEILNDLDFINRIYLFKNAIFCINRSTVYTVTFTLEKPVILKITFNSNKEGQKKAYIEEIENLLTSIKGLLVD